MTQNLPPRLEMRGMTRSFPGIRALDDVSITAWPGEVHALVGENGAGKSTLINILSGVLAPDRGEILLNGAAVQLATPITCREMGIVTVHQEADHFPDLSVAENMALFQGIPLRRLFIDWAAVRGSAEAAVGSLGEAIDVRTAARQLSIGQLHMTQVAAAVTRNAQLLILDEPTSSLSDSESEWLFDQIEQLRQSGAAVLYISHRQEEIFRLADRITVLRDGRRVWHGSTAETDHWRLVEAMVGRPVEPRSRTMRTFTATTPLRLEVEQVCDADANVRDVSLKIRAGEIVGVYGLIGAGRSEFAQAVFGRRVISSGQISVNGKPLQISSPAAAVRAGIAYVPEDRLRQAICGSLSVKANAVLATLRRWSSGPFVSGTCERTAAEEIVTKLGVRLQSIEQPIGSLSGGNQQKVVLGRWLLTEPQVLLLDEPTRGVDVGAKDEIHRLLGELAEAGCGLLLISSELPEVMQHADRVIVFREGRISGEFSPATASAAEVAAAALPSKTPDCDLPDSPATEPGEARRRGRSHTAEWTLAISVVLLALWTGITADGFNVVTLFANASIWALLGLAASTVILAGGIDISIGSLVALAATTCAIVIRLPGPPWCMIPLGITAGVVAGGIGGSVNAAISLVGRIHPIVVTLGTMTIYRGLVIAMLGGKAVTGLPRAFLEIARDPETGIRWAALGAAAVIAGGAIWLNHTRSGRFLFALGSSPRAARLAGVPARRTWILAFAVGGMLAGLAGVIQLAESGQMQSRLGVGWELHAIAVAVIGGVAITGGRGSVTGVVLGALLIRLINGALIRWGIRDTQFDFFVGTMILAAVLLDCVWRRGRTR